MNGAKWRHRDSELERTCGEVVGPVVRETIFGEVSEPFCAACDGEAYGLEVVRSS